MTFEMSIIMPPLPAMIWGVEHPQDSG